MCGKKVHLSADPSFYTTLAFGPGVTLTAYWHDYLVLPSMESDQVTKFLKIAEETFRVENSVSGLWVQVGFFLIHCYRLKVSILYYRIN